MHTERFRKQRKKALEGHFSADRIAEVWRKIVRDQLRKMDIKDLYDHYDFNYNIGLRAAAIRNEILGGTYRVSRPLIYRLEKKYGVCRHLVVPQPADALVMQVLVEGLADDVLKKQPTPRAFYSRDKHALPKPHDAAEYGLDFRSQWKKLQKEIYRFNEEKDLLVVTDIANYYDNIDMDELRRVFENQAAPKEVVVDILFKVMEGISWQPDYLPYRGRGLPTTNLEAIRLLAHSFLFELDEIVDDLSHQSMTRWMDDFVIGVDTKGEAIEILSKMSDVLKSRGLALNLSKTEIYDHAEARRQFQIDENLYLDSVEGLKRGNPGWEEAAAYLHSRLVNHLASNRTRYWGKITKRYITALGRLQSPALLGEIVELYVENPDLRPNLLYYLSSLGYSIESGRQVYDILKGLSVFDDISLNQISQLVVGWEVPATGHGVEFLRDVRAEMGERAFARREPADFLAFLWFRTKYDDSDRLVKFLKQYENLWQTESFLRRQVTAALARLLEPHRNVVDRMISEQLSSGLPGTISLANQIQEFSHAENITQKVAFYLYPKNARGPYPLPKFLVLCSFLNSKAARENPRVHKLTLEHVKDPYYRQWLKDDYGVAP